MMCYLMRHKHICKQLACQFCLMCFVYQFTSNWGVGGSIVDTIAMEQLEIIEITNVFQGSRVLMSPDNYLEEGEDFLYDLIPNL